MRREYFDVCECNDNKYFKNRVPNTRSENTVVYVDMRVRRYIGRLPVNNNRVGIFKLCSVNFSTTFDLSWELRLYYRISCEVHLT